MQPEYQGANDPSWPAAVRQEFLATGRFPCIAAAGNSRPKYVLHGTGHQDVGLRNALVHGTG